MKHLLTVILVGMTGYASPTLAETLTAEGRDVFQTHCATCHGVDATGDGPTAARLPTRPADLTGMAARRGGVWPMLEVMSIIEGYTKLDTPRRDMPAISALTDGPKVELDTGNGQVRAVPKRLVAVAQYLESIQDPKPGRYVP